MDTKKTTPRPSALASGIANNLSSTTELKRGLNSTSSHSSKPVSSPKAKPKKPAEIRTMDVVIAGATYPVNCSVDEKEDLEKAVLYINHFMREIRKDAPTLNHENLLVLCCLNMYEEMKQHRNTQASLRQQDKKMQELIDKISSDAQSILR